MRNSWNPTIQNELNGHGATGLLALERQVPSSTDTFSMPHLTRMDGVCAKGAHRIKVTDCAHLKAYTLKSLNFSDLQILFFYRS